MKKLFACLALAFVAPILGLLHAQDEQASEQYEPPPPEGIDVDYFAPPKQKLTVGLSVLSGPKISFHGSGSIPSDVNPGADSNITTRTYDDGTVAPDARTDAASGTPLQGSANADGKTNIWSYTNASQVNPNGTSVDLHDYSAASDGSNAHSGQASAGTGVDVTYERDFGWHIGSVQFDLIAGVGINKISYSLTRNVTADVTTLTDNYSTYNTTLNPVTGDPVLDVNGNPTYTAGQPQAV